MLILYSCALVLVLILGAPWWLFRMATSGKYRDGLAERLGFVPARMRQGLDGQSVVWVHAVSVGEVLAASRLIEELGSRLAGAAGQAGNKRLARDDFDDDQNRAGAGARALWRGSCVLFSSGSGLGRAGVARRSASKVAGSGRDGVLAAHAGGVPHAGDSGGGGERPHLRSLMAALSPIRVDVALSVARVDGGSGADAIWMRSGCALWARTTCEWQEI